MYYIPHFLGNTQAGRQARVNEECANIQMEYIIVLGSMAVWCGLWLLFGWLLRVITKITCNKEVEPRSQIHCVGQGYDIYRVD